MNKIFSKNLFRKSIFGLSLCLLLAGAEAGGKRELRIYLPSEKTLSSDVITLGQVGMILGEQALVKRLDTIALGQFTHPGQELKLDQKTILSRIAGEGIKASVYFNGAETMCLRREGDCILADQFVAAAKEHLEKKLADQGVQSVKLLRSPDNFPLSCENEEITLSAQMAGSQAGQTRRVTVSAKHKGVQLCQQDVIFTIQYQCQRFVATRDLPAQTLVSTENTKIETYLSSLPQKKSQSIHGMKTRRAISKGAEIPPHLVEPEEPVLLVKRRQKVLLRLETGGLLVSAPGEAMNDGSVGDLIEVRRGKGREQRTILGRIMSDGTVKPII